MILLENILIELVEFYVFIVITICCFVEISN